MTNETNSAPEQETSPVDTGIGINDLILARNVIQVASKRGAFTDPNEYREIGQLFQKLDAFVKQVEAQVAEQKEAAEASTDSDEKSEDA